MAGKPYRKPAGRRPSAKPSKAEREARARMNHRILGLVALVSTLESRIDSLVVDFVMMQQRVNVIYNENPLGDKATGGET